MVVASVPAELKDCIRFLCISLEEELRLLFIAELLFLDCFSFVPAFPYLRSLITESCSRSSIVARLRSQNDLVQNGFSYVKKAIPGSLSLGTPNLST